MLCVSTKTTLFGEAPVQNPCCFASSVGDRLKSEAESKWRLELVKPIQVVAPIADKHVAVTDAPQIKRAGAVQNTTGKKIFALFENIKPNLASRKKDQIEEPKAKEPEAPSRKLKTNNSR